MKKILSLVALTMLSIVGMNAETVKYALNEGDSFTSGQTVEVKNGDAVVATITYGESGGADFKAAKAYTNVEGYTAFTEGNGTNGNKEGGTFYTITPKFDGKIAVAVVLNADKAFYIEEDGTALDDYNGIKVAEKYYGTFDIDVKAGKAYKVYCAGSKLGFFGFEMTYEGGEPSVPATPTFDFSSPDFRENIGESMTDTKGYIYNETFKAADVTLQITGGSAPSRVYTDGNRGQCLVIYKEYSTLTFEAPEGKAITKIEFTAAGNSNIKNFAASSGTIEEMTWTGNAEGVRFTQGGTSYLAKAIVTLEGVSATTGILQPIEYRYCENIAAFNALDAGTYAWLKLTDAEVIAKSADGYSTVFIQDATGGAWIQYTSLNDKLQEMTKVNGDIYVVKRVASGNPQIKEAEDTPYSKLQAEAINALTIIEGKTIAEVNVPENLNRVVKFTGATLQETSATAGTLTLGEETIAVSNGTATANQQLCKIANWAKDTKFEDITIIAILVAKSATENQLLPLSIEGTTVSIQNVNASAATDNAIYSLQGVRMNKVQKGIFVVNGKKVVLK